VDVELDRETDKLGDITGRRHDDVLQVIKSRRSWKHAKCCLRLAFMPLNVYELLLHDVNAFNYFYTQASTAVAVRVLVVMSA